MDNRSIRIIAGVVGAATVSALIAGCAPSTTPASPSSTPTGEVRAVWWGSDQRTAATNEAFALIEAKYPGLTLSGEGSSYDGYFEKFATQLAGGTAPDIIQQNLIGPLQQFANQGALLPLDEYFGDELDVSGFEAFIDYGRVGDATYGIPLSQTTFAAIYDPQQFAELGVDAPADSWDWDDFETLARDIVEASGGAIAGGTDASFEVFNYEIWHYGRTGNDIYDAEGQRQDTPELLAEWLQMWQDFREEGLIVSPDVQAAHRIGETATSPFVIGRAAITFDYSTNFPAYEPLIGSIAAMAPSPASGSHPNNYITPTSLWSINAESENVGAALAVVDELINDPEVQGVLGMTRGLPINPTAIEIVEPTLDESGKVVADFIAELSQSELRLLQSDVPEGGVDADALYRRVAEDVAFGRMSAEEGAASFFDQVARFL